MAPVTVIPPLPVDCKVKLPKVIVWLPAVPRVMVLLVVPVFSMVVVAKVRTGMD